MSGQTPRFYPPSGSDFSYSKAGGDIGVGVGVNRKSRSPEKMKDLPKIRNSHGLLGLCRTQTSLPIRPLIPGHLQAGKKKHLTQLNKHLPSQELATWVSPCKNPEGKVAGPRDARSRHSMDTACQRGWWAVARLHKIKALSTRYPRLWGFLCFSFPSG